MLIAGDKPINVTPPNLPPEWTSTPAPSFVTAVGGTYDLNDNVNDPEGDTLTWALNGASAALPTGVTLDTGTGVLTGTGSVTEGTTTGILIDVDDGVNSAVTSPSITITVSALSAAPNLIGGFGTRSDLDRSNGFTIYTVTNTNDSGTGSLRAALEATGNRVVIFETSGVIEITDDIVIPDGDLIVAGQTAPSPGIMVYGPGGIIIGAAGGVNNVLIQHITMANSDTSGGAASGDRDAMRVDRFCNSIIIDHCTMLWGIDETASVWTFASQIIDNVTISNCIIAEGLYKNDLTGNVVRGKGLIVGGALTAAAPTNVSVVNCLFAHNVERNPLCEDVYFVNNVVYNVSYQSSEMRGDTSGIAASTADFVGNVYLEGLNTATSRKPMSVFDLTNDSELYFTDNTCDWIEITTDEYTDYIFERRNVDASAIKSSSHNFSPPDHTPISNTGTTVLDTVLLNCGSRPADRETHAARIVADVTAGTGRLKHGVENLTTSGDGSSEAVPGGKPTLAENTTSHSTPASPNDIAASGYTNIEEWLHTFYASVEP